MWGSLRLAPIIVLMYMYASSALNLFFSSSYSSSFPFFSSFYFSSSSSSSSSSSFSSSSFCLLHLLLHLFPLFSAASLSPQYPWGQDNINATANTVSVGEVLQFSRESGLYHTRGKSRFNSGWVKYRCVFSCFQFCLISFFKLVNIIN